MTVAEQSPRVASPRNVDTITAPPVRTADDVATRPVFADVTGRRVHRVRRWGIVLAVPAVAYLVAVGSSLLGGSSLPSALLLTDEPSDNAVVSADDAAATAGFEFVPALPDLIEAATTTGHDPGTQPARSRSMTSNNGPNDAAAANRRTPSRPTTSNNRPNDAAAANRRARPTQSRPTTSDNKPNDAAANRPEGQHPTPAGQPDGSHPSHAHDGRPRGERPAEVPRTLSASAQLPAG